jgi:hypothetical protein
VRVPRTDAAGMADAMIEALFSYTQRCERVMLCKPQHWRVYLT